jgi:hypothetical protein
MHAAMDGSRARGTQPPGRDNACSATQTRPHLIGNEVIGNEIHLRMYVWISRPVGRRTIGNVEGESRVQRRGSDKCMAGDERGGWTPSVSDGLRDACDVSCYGRRRTVSLTMGLSLAALLMRTLAG